MVAHTGAAVRTPGRPGAASYRLPTDTVTGNGSYQCSPQAMGLSSARGCQTLALCLVGTQGQRRVWPRVTLLLALLLCSLPFPEAESVLLQDWLLFRSAGTVVAILSSQLVCFPANLHDRRCAARYVADSKAVNACWPPVVT